MNKKLAISLVLLTLVGIAGLFAKSLQCYEGGTVTVNAWGTKITAYSTSPKAQSFDVDVLFTDGSSKRYHMRISAASINKDGQITSQAYAEAETGKSIDKIVSCAF